MKCSEDAVLQAAAILTAAKVAHGLAENGNSGPDIGQTLALSIVDVLDGINEFNQSDTGSGMEDWGTKSSS